MKGYEEWLHAYMEGSSKRFVIPVYQRKYDWKTENCKHLYDDLVKVVRQGRKSHFFGSLVSVFNPDGDDEEFLVIDGQQRLITVSLLLLAMHNLLEQGAIRSEKANLGKQIYEKYLIDEYHEGGLRTKLKPVKEDRLAYRRLFDRTEEKVPGSKVTVNYDYFYNRIQKEEITVDELLSAIKRLEIINVRLNGDDNPQLIFESLNSTGVALSEGDKIRNFVLMNLSSHEQNAYYEKYWDKIEKNTEVKNDDGKVADHDVSPFVRDYLSVKQRVIPTQSKVYFTFKSYVEDGKIETGPLLEDLLSYSKWYKILLHGGTKNKPLDACIYRLNLLETTVTRPFFLEVLRLQAEGKLTLENVTEIFLTVENYLTRRSICNVPTNVLNNMFVALHREILRYDGTEDNYVEKFKYALLSKKDRARFPDDTEFASEFGARQVYLMNSKNKIYILERLENQTSKESKDVYQHFEDDEYSIEHIMPQHLTPEWKTALGDDCEQIHALWLHRIANLTLTAYNSNYSNSSFQAKKTMKNGFADSGIKMNLEIAQKEKWGLPELEERSAYLTQRALGIWERPVTDYKPAEKQLDNYTLDDEDLPATGREIAKFVYKDAEQPVTSWTDMFERVLKILHDEDKSVLSALASAPDDAGDLSPYVSATKAFVNGTLKIDEGIFVKYNTSTSLKISLLRKFFKAFGADPTDLTFYLADEADADKVEKDIKKLHEIRLKYWGFALKIIKEAMDGRGPFSCASPVKDNWVNGYIGIQGVYLSCVANFNAARVELCMAKSVKEANKKIYDSLKAHQGEIESALGVPLGWARGDDIKISRIYYQLDGVGITNETDWTQMAKFQGEWSRKFYDAIMPFLKKA